VAETPIYRCIICGTEAPNRPPRRCPKCGAPAARWRLVVDRPPAPKSAPAAEVRVG
jgi:DNA-directed RNA polymerase subunit RPC12/RpoP